ncbi:hypothetical protein VTG60DRAFT_2965 [Thermothelomyces hinnuleus]
MTRVTKQLLTILALAGAVAAHMQMRYPPPLRSSYNPHAAAAGDVDYSMTSPLRADGSDFPCKGSLALLGTPLLGRAVATWSAGGEYNFTLAAGGAPHGGGSCQAALSVDGGRTFRVLHSYEGACPAAAAAAAAAAAPGGEGENAFRFAVPADVPATRGAVFAWTWFNNLGNREMYMNCAVVDITAAAGGSGSGKEKKVAFTSRPGLFVANIGNGCRTIEGTDVKFPDPGPDVDSQGTPAPPTGNCGSSHGASEENSPGSPGEASSSTGANDAPFSSPGDGQPEPDSTQTPAADYEADSISLSLFW